MNSSTTWAKSKIKFRHRNYLSKAKINFPSFEPSCIVFVLWNKHTGYVQWRSLKEVSNFSSVLFASTEWRSRRPFFLCKWFQSFIPLQCFWRLAVFEYYFKFQYHTKLLRLWYPQISWYGNTWTIYQLMKKHVYYAP